MTEIYEVEETIGQLRRIAEEHDLNSHDKYWIEEAVCSLLGMESRIQDLEGEEE